MYLLRRQITLIRPFNFIHLCIIFHVKALDFFLSFPREPVEPDTLSLWMDLFSLDSVILIIVTCNCLPFSYSRPIFRTQFMTSAFGASKFETLLGENTPRPTCDIAPPPPHPTPPPKKNKQNSLQPCNHETRTKAHGCSYLLCSFTPF